MAGAGSKRRDAKNTRSFITYSWEKALKPQNLVNAKSPANPKDERGVFRISVSSARAGRGPREAMRRAYTLQLGEGSETPKPGQRREAVRARIFSAVRNDTRFMVYKSLFSSPLFSRIIQNPD